MPRDHSAGVSPPPTFGPSRLGSLAITPAIAFLLALFAAFAHAQTIYKCTAKDGKVTFSDEPCAGDAHSVVSQGRKEAPAAASVSDARMIEEAKTRTAKLLGRPASAITYKDLRVSRENNMGPLVCGIADGKRFVSAVGEHAADPLMEGRGSVTSFLQTWNSSCTGRNPDQALANPGGQFEEFKKALAAGNDTQAVVIMVLAERSLAQRMKSHAESLCTNGDKAACLLLHCPGGTTNDAAYHSPKCAELTGRAHGNGWVESRVTQKASWLEYSIKCVTNNPRVPAYAYAWCDQPHANCRPGIWTGRPEHRTGPAATFEQVARQECSAR